MGAVGSNTAFCLEDHPTDQNWIETIRPSNRPSPRLDPIVPLHQASLRLHNLPLSAVQDIPGTGGKTNKTVLRTCQLCLTESTHGVKKIETNRWRCRKPTGWRAGGRRRQRAYGNRKDGTACPVFGAVTASACAFLVRFQCSREKFNAWMSAALL